MLLLATLFSTICRALTETMTAWTKGRIVLFDNSMHWHSSSLSSHGSACRQYFGRLKISDSQNSWHMSVPFPVLASMNLRHHNSVAIQPVSDVTDPPRKLNLHPIAGSCSSSLQQLRAYPSKDLQDLFAAWIQAQSDASCPVSPVLGCQYEYLYWVGDSSLCKSCLPASYGLGCREAVSAFFVL